MNAHPEVQTQTYMSFYLVIKYYIGMDQKTHLLCGIIHYRKLAVTRSTKHYISEPFAKS